MYVFGPSFLLRVCGISLVEISALRPTTIEVIRGFSQSLQNNSDVVLQIKLTTTSTPFPIHYSLIIIPSDTISSELLIAY
jgi:hypothetical protein